MAITEQLLNSAANQFSTAEEPSAAVWNSRVLDVHDDENIARGILETGFLALPTLTLDNTLHKVDVELVAPGLLIDGHRFAGTSYFAFTTETTGTYYLQVMDDGTLSKVITTPNAGYQTIGHVVWTLATLTLSAVTVTATLMAAGSGSGNVTAPGGGAVAHNLAGFTDVTGTELEDSGLAPADVEDAVDLKHAQLHDNTDHTGLAYNAAGSSALTFATLAGRIRRDNAVVDVSATTTALTDNTTNYVEVDNTGAVAKTTIGFTSGKIPLHTVVTSGGAISSVTDARTWLTIPTDPGSMGDVTGPASSTDNYLTVFNGTTGKVLKVLAVAGSAITTALTNLGIVIAGLAAHLIDDTNPHAVTAAQVGSATAQWNANEIDGVPVDLAGIVATQVLAYNGASVVPVAAGSGVDIAGATATTDTPDAVNDYLLLYDNSQGANRKIKASDYNKSVTKTDVGLSAVTNDAQVKASEKAAASGVATLSAGSLVVQNPANATATPTASKIPIADGSGLLDSWVTANPTAAVASDLNTGTNTDKFVTADALAGSNAGRRGFTVNLNTVVALTGTEIRYVRIPSCADGMNLVEVAAMCKVASSSGAVTATVKNGTTSMLSTNITIDAGEYDTGTAATPAVIDTAHDDVATGAQIEIALTAHGTGVTHCAVELQFALP